MNMKKIISLLLGALLLLGAAAALADETVTITALNGQNEAVELTVPYNPQRIAILDMAALSCRRSAWSAA